MILTPGQFREHVVTAVEDDALRRLLDAAEAAIVEVAGPPGVDVVELVEGHRWADLFLSHAAASIASVREWNGSDWNAALTANADYRVVNATILHRVNGSWHRRVEVTYTPVNDAAKRIQAQIKLVELELNRPAGVTSTSIGGFSAGGFTEGVVADYRAEREMILNTLRPPLGILVFGD